MHTHQAHFCTTTSDGTIMDTSCWVFPGNFVLQGLYINCLTKHQGRQTSSPHHTSLSLDPSSRIASISVAIVDGVTVNIP
jgi:hypothetical protein